jgi:hypothetical protein
LDTYDTGLAILVVGQDLCKARDSALMVLTHQISHGGDSEDSLEEATFFAKNVIHLLPHKICSSPAGPY